MRRVTIFDQRFRDGIGGQAVQIRHHHGRTGLCQRAGKLFAKQPGSPGDDGYLALHLELFQNVAHP